MLAVLVGSVAAIGIASAIVLYWPMASVAGADPDDPEQVAMGRMAYQQYCAPCHGAKLEGQPNWRIRKPDGKLPAPPHDQTGHTWHHPDQHLFRITKNGVKAPLAPVGCFATYGAVRAKQTALCKRTE
ncbi:MAG TPA: cytochrome c [Rhodospirillales bacterium]|nr:cytochrome c [Rhodospirillales bacterium]